MSVATAARRTESAASQYGSSLIIVGSVGAIVVARAGRR